MKLKGFTLLELLIGMIISSIVISVCYTVYYMVNKQYVEFREVRSELVNLMFLNSELENNFYHSNNVQMSDKELCFGYRDKSICFVFMDSVVVRKEAMVSDTFRVKVNNFEIIENNEGLVSSFYINAILLEDSVSLCFNKKYSAFELINGFNKKESND
ncbi:MAG: prepilin-type N-terminal cleavage/methylation domain-containing protein [Bacteroidetes bacterium]|nr:prepilin-type N-terminal cleavage/methylation domain-containing protein [Bacteroidota bacterium]